MSSDRLGEFKIKIKFQNLNFNTSNKTDRGRLQEIQNKEFDLENTHGILENWSLSTGSSNQRFHSTLKFRYILANVTNLRKKPFLYQLDRDFTSQLNV